MSQPPGNTEYIPRAWQLPANLNTDVLAPGIYMKLPVEEIAAHCLESVIPGFASEVKAGDVIVAGPNFGVGSSREQAAGVLRVLGVAAIFAPSYAGLFYRNALNLGLPAFVCPQAESVPDRVAVQWDVNGARLLWNDGKDKVTYEPLPNFLQEMIDQGGLLAQLKSRLANRENTN
jgi:3-isopropylmalate/(R)-2-methylmalate dehydratase small subunit